MADVVKTTYTLVLLAGFADEDDRTITITNPKENLSKAQIEAAIGETAIPVLIGDRYAAEFTRWKSAKYRNSTIVDFDLE